MEFKNSLDRDMHNSFGQFLLLSHVINHLSCWNGYNLEFARSLNSTMSEDSTALASQDTGSGVIFHFIVEFKLYNFYIIK